MGRPYLRPTGSQAVPAWTPCSMVVIPLATLGPTIQKNPIPVGGITYCRASKYTWARGGGEAVQQTQNVPDIPGLGQKLSGYPRNVPDSVHTLSPECIKQCPDTPRLRPSDQMLPQCDPPFEASTKLPLVVFW